MKIVINESDLKKVINTINSEEHAITELKERYSNMSDDDKELCVSLIEYFNPHLKLQLNEAEWYNTVLDILGVVDPTPIVDTLNGISYFTIIFPLPLLSKIGFVVTIISTSSQNSFSLNLLIKYREIIP